MFISCNPTIFLKGNMIKSFCLNFGALHCTNQYFLCLCMNCQWYNGAKLWADIALVIIKFAILLMIDSIANNWKQKKIYNTFLHNFVITSYLQFERLFYKSIKFKV